MKFVIALVSGEGKFQKIEGYYAGWNYNAHGHPDGFKVAQDVEGAEKFESQEKAQIQISGDPRLGGTKIMMV